MFDTKALAGPIAVIVREVVAASVPLAVEAAIAPLLARIAELEGRTVEPGQPGKDADPELIRSMVEQAVAAIEIPTPKDGVSVDPDEVRGMVADAVAALPPAEPGKDADPELVRGIVAEAIAEIDLPQPRDPVDADMDQVRTWIAEEIAALPVPADGKSITVEDVEPLIREAIGVAVAAIPPAKDGVGMAGALLGREGDLVVTLTDGSVHSLGTVVGRDYDETVLKNAVAAAVAEIPKPEDGQPGRDADPEVIKQMVDEAVALIPAPENGKDAYPGEARGLFDPEATYRALDMVTLNGCEWRAKVDNPGALPGDGWMLSAQRGKQGKPGEPGKPGKTAPEPIALYTDPKAMQLVLTKDDGTELKADLTDIVRVIRDA